MRTLLAVMTALTLLAAASAQPAQTPAAAPASGVVRAERGALITENVPEASAAVRERLRQYVNTRAAGFADWTPDGGMLITTRFGDTSQVHALRMPMGARTQLTFFPEPVGGAIWRPGSPSQFAYVKDTGGDENFAAYLFDRASGRSVQVSQPGARIVGFVFNEDGSQAAWAVTPQGSPDYDIFVGNPDAPQSARQVLDGQGAVAPIAFSRDGSKLLVGQSISVTESRRFVLDVASGQMIEIAPDLDVAFGGGAFTPDGRAVILTSDEGTDFQRLVRVDLATGARSPLGEAVPWDVDGFELADDGRTLAYETNEDGVSVLRLLDLRTGRALPAPRLPQGVLGGYGFDPQSRRLGLTLTTATTPGDVYSYDLRSRVLTRWTESEVGGLNPATFVAPTLISWPSFDGRQISGLMYTPTTPGPHPVVIDIHGGPEGQSRPVFNPRIQYWVNELGIAVILPNVRGSTGYGKAFVALDNAEKREDSVKDIGALLDWIAARDTLNEDRVVVYGGSYGGYMVLASMVHYNARLTGAVNIVGISNFVTFLENTSGYRRDLRRVEYGDERDPAMRAVLERISPLTNISRVTKPMFVIHGANDPRVPVSEAVQVTEAIRRNGGEVWSMIARDEGHGFRRRGNQEAQREAETLFLQRVFGASGAQN